MMIDWLYQDIQIARFHYYVINGWFWLCMAVLVMTFVVCWIDHFLEEKERKKEAEKIKKEIREKRENKTLPPAEDQKESWYIHQYFLKSYELKSGYYEAQLLAMRTKERFEKVKTDRMIPIAVNIPEETQMYCDDGLMKKLGSTANKKEVDFYQL